jgi:hypothetical protein
MRNATPAAMATSKSIGSRSDGAICITVRPTQTAKSKGALTRTNRQATRRLQHVFSQQGSRTPNGITEQSTD